MDVHETLSFPCPAFPSSCFSSRRRVRGGVQRQSLWKPIQAQIIGIPNRKVLSIGRECRPRPSLWKISDRYYRKGISRVAVINCEVLVQKERRVTLPFTGFKCESAAVPTCASKPARSINYGLFRQDPTVGIHDLNGAASELPASNIHRNPWTKFASAKCFQPRYVVARSTWGRCRRRFISGTKVGIKYARRAALYLYVVIICRIDIWHCAPAPGEIYFVLLCSRPQI